MESGNSSSLHSSTDPDDDHPSPSTDALSAFLAAPPSPFLDPIAAILGPAWIPPAPLRLPPPPPDPAPRTHLPLRPPPPPPPLASSSPTPPRASRKRARASRRAPTTVLTTDTSNFRRMVQEFTGIPTPPFASLARPRLDLLHAASASPSSSSPFHLRLFDPSALLRPFPAPPPPLAPMQQQPRAPASTPVFTFQSLLQNAAPVPLSAGNPTAPSPPEKRPESSAAAAATTTQGTMDSSWISSLEH